MTESRREKKERPQIRSQTGVSNTHLFDSHSLKKEDGVKMSLRAAIGAGALKIKASTKKGVSLIYLFTDTVIDSRNRSKTLQSMSYTN